MYTCISLSLYIYIYMYLYIYIYIHMVRGLLAVRHHVQPGGPRAFLLAEAMFIL